MKSYNIERKNFSSFTTTETTTTTHYNFARFKRRNLRSADEEGAFSVNDPCGRNVSHLVISIRKTRRVPLAIINWDRFLIRRRLAKVFHVGDEGKIHSHFHRLMKSYFYDYFVTSFFGISLLSLCGE